MQHVIHWFREDLRLEDNPALSAASDAGLPIISLYILDEDHSNSFKVGPAQKIWLHFFLKSLEKSLKKYSIPLVIEKGKLVEVWQKLLKKISPKQVTWNRSFNQFIAKRDGKIRQLLENHDVNVQDFNGTFLIDPSAFTNQSGGFYRVFAPFLKCYPKAYEPLKVSKLHQNRSMSKVKSYLIDELHLLDQAVLSPEKLLESWEPGEEGAEKQLRKFIKTSLQGYSHDRNYPGLNNTSKLSPHLHAPWKAPEQVLQEANLKLGKDYPLPIVDHDQAKQFALKEFKRIKKSSS